MKAPHILIALAAVILLAACSGTPTPDVEPSPTSPDDTVVILTKQCNDLRNASPEAIIYNGVCTAQEFFFKLIDGDSFSNGQTNHSSEQLSAIYGAETPALTQGPEPELGQLGADGIVVSNKGQIIAYDVWIRVRRPGGGTSYPADFTHTTPAKLLAGYGATAVPILVYMVRDRFDPTQLAFAAGIVTAGGEIVHPIESTLIPRGPVTGPPRRPVTPIPTPSPTGAAAIHGSTNTTGTKIIN